MSKVVTVGEIVSGVAGSYASSGGSSPSSKASASASFASAIASAAGQSKHPFVSGLGSGFGPGAGVTQLGLSMTSRTISGLIEAGASGFESAANYLDLTYPSTSHFGWEYE